MNNFTTFFATSVNHIYALLSPITNGFHPAFPQNRNKCLNKCSTSPHKTMLCSMNQIVLKLREGCPMALYLAFTCFSANLVAQLAEIRRKTGFSAINSAHCSRVVAMSGHSAAAAAATKKRTGFPIRFRRFLAISTIPQKFWLMGTRSAFSRLNKGFKPLVCTGFTHEPKF
jgi:hypothetical protein